MKIALENLCVPHILPSACWRLALALAFAATFWVAAPGVALAQSPSSQATVPEGAISEGNDYGVLDLDAYVQSLPETSEGIIADRTVVDRGSAAVRVFRLYDAVPMHYHARSDTYLYVLSGRGRFEVAGESREAGTGALLFWKKGVPHGLAEVLERPLVILAFDAPTRGPDDTIWSDPADASSFLSSSGGE